MGRYLFRLPDVGEGVAEAEIAAWHVKAGDVVKEDQNLVDVMTDKATVDMTSPVDGVVKATYGEVGSMLPVGSVLVELDVDGEGNAPPAEEKHAAAAAQMPAPAPAPILEATPTKSIMLTEPPGKATTSNSAPSQQTPSRRAFTTRTIGDPPIASPATRRRAFELGIALQFVPATGPGGRITAEDLDAFVDSGGAVPAGDPRYVAREGVAQTRIIGVRRRIAEKMQEAKRRIPHITYVEEVDVTELEALRADLNAHRGADQPKLTLLPFFMRALVRALPDFPQVNARFDDEARVLSSFEAVHIGIATQTESGLMVPVVRHAESRNVWELATELARVTRAARHGSAARDELSGSTITITSLGTLGGITTTPVINHPEVAIIGPNKIVERPIVDGSFVTVRKMMNLSSSFDHRIVDGHDAALFVQRLKRLIEHPALIFMD